MSEEKKAPECGNCVYSKRVPDVGTWHCYLNPPPWKVITPSWVCGQWWPNDLDGEVLTLPEFLRRCHLNKK